MYVERCGKEGEITNQPDQPGAGTLPERPFPSEDAAIIQETFDDYGKGSKDYAKEYAVIDAQDFCLLVFWQHQAVMPKIRNIMEISTL